MEEPSSGHVYLNGELVGSKHGNKMKYKQPDLCKLRTRVGMVFQHFNLFPHMTVFAKCHGRSINRSQAQPC